MAIDKEEPNPRGPGLNIKLTELRFICVVGLVLLAVTSIPTVYGYVTTPADKWFSGVVDNVHDTAQYLSWMRESRSRLFIDNKLTSEPNPAVFLNLHWWIPGRLAAIVGLSLPQVYQILRLLAVPLLTVATYVFCALLFEDRTRRLFAFLMSIFTSGLGWVWVVQKQITGKLDFPRDVHTTLGNSLFTMTSSPHLAFATALTFLVLCLAFLGIRRRRGGFSLTAGFLALFLGMGHIYDLVTVWSVLGVFGLLVTLRDGWSWRVSWRLAAVVVISAPSALYWGWVASDANPMWKQALSQYDNLGVFTPDPVHLLVLLGLTFIVALTTFKGMVPLPRQSDRGLFIRGWFSVTLLLVYLPLHFRIMLLAGYQLPMAVLATQGLFNHILPWVQERLSDGRWGRLLSRERLARWMPALLLLAVLPTNLYLLAWRVVDLNRHGYPFYLYEDDVKAMRWLEENTDPDCVVLTSFAIGHYIPGLTGRKAFLANAVMTMGFVHKRELVRRFFDSAVSDEERRVFVRDYDIGYVFRGPAERALGDYDPGTSPWLALTFSTPQTAVYSVRSDRIRLSLGSGGRP